MSTDLPNPASDRSFLQRPQVFKYIQQLQEYCKSKGWRLRLDPMVALDPDSQKYSHPVYQDVARRIELHGVEAGVTAAQSRDLIN